MSAPIRRPVRIEDLDVPAAQVAAEAKTLKAKRVLSEARSKSHSPSDRLAYAYDQYLITHPAACATGDDYPGWTPEGGEQS